VVATSHLLAKITHFWEGDKYTIEQTMQTVAYFDRLTLVLQNGYVSTLIS